MRYALVILLAVVGCGPNLTNASYPASEFPDPRGKELVLGVGDVVGINVWDQKELNTDATIRPDGTITMPLVGDIHAAGETPTALKDKIKAGLQNYIKLGAGNEVTVAVKAWKSYRFTIEGEVTRQGVFTSDQYVRVADAIALAGGPTRFAKRNELKLFRTEKGQMKTVELDYEAIMSGKRLDMNIWVLPGDVIYMP